MLTSIWYNIQTCKAVRDCVGNFFFAFNAQPMWNFSSNQYVHLYNFLPSRAMIHSFFFFSLIFCWNMKTDRLSSLTCEDQKTRLFLPRESNTQSVFPRGFSFFSKLKIGKPYHFSFKESKINYTYEWIKAMKYHCK